MNNILCSTGAFTGRSNGYNYSVKIVKISEKIVKE